MASPPFQVVPVSSCLLESRRGCPCPTEGSRHLHPWRLANISWLTRVVMCTQGHGLGAPSPIARGSTWRRVYSPLCKSISVLIVELDSVTMTAHQQSVLNCLYKFKYKTVVSLKYFQKLLGHRASSVAVTSVGLKYMRPLQHWLHDRITRWAWCRSSKSVPITPVCHHTFSPWMDSTSRNVSYHQRWQTQQLRLQPSLLGRYMPWSGTSSLLCALGKI